LSAVLFFLEQGGILLALAAAAAGAGWWAVRFLPAGPGAAGRLERFTLAAALGLVVLAQAGLLLGLAGWLRPLPVLGVAVAALLAGLPVWRGLIATRAAPRAVPARRILGVGGAAAVALAPFALLSLYPPTGFDATLYHLPFARAFVETGGLPFLATLRFPVFPQANEVLFAEVMLFSRDVAAHGVELLAGLLTAALVWVWGRAAFGAAAGWIAAAVFLGNPIMAHLSGEAYIEPLLALYTTASLYAGWRWRTAGEGEGGGALSRAAGEGRGGGFQERAARRALAWLALAAAFAAAAASVKYLGLFFLAVAGLLTLLPPRGVPRLRALLVAGAVVLAVAGPWYARNAAWTGNPLFPFYPRLFGESAWSPIIFHGLTPGQTLAERLAELLRMPWDAVFDRGDFGQQPPFSPVYLTALPLAALAAVRERRLRWILLVTGVYAYACTSLPRDSRYLVSVLPLASLAAGGAAARLLPRTERARRLAGAVLCLLCFLPAWCYGIYRIVRQGPVPVTAEEREAYLARRLPLYAALDHLNRIYGSHYSVYGLWSEQMAYYARGRFVGDWFGPYRFHDIAFTTHDAADFHRKLRAAGAGYLLVPTAGRGLPVPEDAAFARWFRPVYADTNARVFALAPR
jgi:4-amino-4-deoxy-L-arabinose transferase-like glycosyltransferase